jgi:hypothetical protein
MVFFAVSLTQALNLHFFLYIGQKPSWCLDGLWTYTASYAMDRNRGFLASPSRLVGSGFTPTNSAQMCTIVTAALQRQYLQTELILWKRLVFYSIRNFFLWVTSVSTLIKCQWLVIHSDCIISDPMYSTSTIIFPSQSELYSLHIVRIQLSGDGPSEGLVSPYMTTCLL